MQASELRDPGNPQPALRPPGVFLETQVSRFWFPPQFPFSNFPNPYCSQGPRLSNSELESYKEQDSVPKREKSERVPHTGFLLDFTQDAKESRLHAVAVEGVFP